MKAKTVLVPEYIFNGSQFGILIREFMSIDFFWSQSQVAPRETAVLAISARIAGL